MGPRHMTICPRVNATYRLTRRWTHLHNSRTLIEITERSGPTESTFFRHFPDNREVLAPDTLVDASVADARWSRAGFRASCLRELALGSMSPRTNANAKIRMRRAMGARTTAEPDEFPGRVLPVHVRAGGSRDLPFRMTVGPPLRSWTAFLRSRHAHILLLRGARVPRHG